MKAIGFALCFISGFIMSSYGVPPIAIILIVSLYTVGLLLLSEQL